MPQDLDQITLATPKAEDLTAIRVPRPRPCWTFSARLFMPQRMSVTPPAIQTFTPAGNAIMTHPRRATGGQEWSDQARLGSSVVGRSAGRSRSTYRRPPGVEPSSRKMLQTAAKSKAARSSLMRKRSEARFGTPAARSSTMTATIHNAVLSPNPAGIRADFLRQSAPSLHPTNLDGDQDRRRTEPQWGK